MPVTDKISRKLMLDSLRQYAKRKIPYDLIRELDQKNEFPIDILKEMYDPEILGVHLLLIPEEHGGLGGSTLDIYQICEELARIDLGIATSVFATFLGSDPLRVGATDEQKQYWFKRIANEKLLVAYAATEADAGSDLVALKTRAEHVIKDGKLAGYKITGNKQWISNGGVADIYTVLALAPGGPTWFMVEKTSEGFSANKHEDKHGIRLSNTAGLSFDEVFVPVNRRIGNEEGQGFLQAQAVFGYTRLMVAAFGLGAGEEALEIAAKYAQQRMQAGSVLSQKQGYMHKLIVPHAIRLEAARFYIDEIAHRLDGEEHGLQTEGAIAKYYATEEGNKTAEAAIQALGGYGYTRDFPVEKIKRDVKITCIYEGTNEIMEMTIYRGRWQEHLKSRGQYYANQAAEFDKLHAQNPDIGADSIALCLKGLSYILEQARAQRLTRHQYVTFKLGEIIANAEVAAVFTKNSAADGKYPEGTKFDSECVRAMARVNARETAFDVITNGAKIVLGAGDLNGAELTQNINLTEIIDKQKAVTQDKDFIVAKLNEIFKR
jgi:alkylation response protein AidB-like acyl-CoA dehydrogenase